MLSERVETLRSELREAAYSISAPPEAETDDWDQLLIPEMGLRNALNRMYRTNRQLSSELRALSGSVSRDTIKIRDDGIERLEAVEELNKMIDAVEIRRQQKSQTESIANTESPTLSDLRMPSLTFKEKPLPHLSPAALEVISKHKGRGMSEVGVVHPPLVTQKIEIEPHLRSCLSPKSSQKDSIKTVNEQQHYLSQPQQEGIEEESESQGSPSPAARMPSDLKTSAVRPNIPIGRSQNDGVRGSSISKVPEGAPPENIPSFRKKILRSQSVPNTPETVDKNKNIILITDSPDRLSRVQYDDGYSNPTEDNPYYQYDNLSGESIKREDSKLYSEYFKLGSPEFQQISPVDTNQRVEERRRISSPLKGYTATPRRHPSPVREPSSFRSSSTSDGRKGKDEYSLQYVAVRERSGTPNSRCSSCGGEVRSQSPTSSFTRLLSNTESSSRKRNLTPKQTPTKPPWRIVGRYVFVFFFLKIEI